jgi:hypothetical protein
LINSSDELRIIDFDLSAEFTKENVCEDIVNLCKLFHSLVKIDRKTMPNDLSQILQYRKDSILKKYNNVDAILKDLENLMGK